MAREVEQYVLGQKSRDAPSACSLADTQPTSKPCLPQVRGTLEEQIMSLQRFKLDVAATLVNSDNMSLAAMDTGNLLDVFTLREGAAPGQPAAQQPAAADAEAAAAAAAAAGGKKGGAGLASLLAGLGNLEQSEAQYAGEFDLRQFQAKLAQQPQQGGEG